MQAKKVLVDITEPRRLCLQELTASGHFIKWVKEALEGKKECQHVFVFLFSTKKYTQYNTWVVRVIEASEQCIFKGNDSNIYSKNTG